MTEIDKRNLKNYLYITFGITYIAWGILAIFTQSHILGLETIIGRTFTYSRCTWTSYCKWLLFEKE